MEGGGEGGAAALVGSWGGVGNSRVGSEEERAEYEVLGEERSDDLLHILASLSYTSSTLY